MCVGLEVVEDAVEVGAGRALVAQGRQPQRPVQGLLLPEAGALLEQAFGLGPLGAGEAVAVDLVGVDVGHQLGVLLEEDQALGAEHVVLAGGLVGAGQLGGQELVVDEVLDRRFLEGAVLEGHDPVADQHPLQGDRVVGVVLVVEVDLPGQVRDVLARVALASDPEGPVGVGWELLAPGEQGLEHVLGSHGVIDGFVLLVVGGKTHSGR